MICVAECVKTGSETRQTLFKQVNQFSDKIYQYFLNRKTITMKLFSCFEDLLETGKMRLEAVKEIIRSTHLKENVSICSTL